MFAYCLNNPVNMVDSQGDVAIIDDALLLLLLLLVGTIETAAYVGTDVSTSSASNIGGILSDPLPAIKETYVETFVVAAVMVTVLTTPRTGSGITVVKAKSKGKENQKDSGLIGTSDAEIARRIKDPQTSKKEKKRLQKEQKARGNRNKSKRAEYSKGPRYEIR